MEGKTEGSKRAIRAWTVALGVFLVSMGMAGRSLLGADPEPVELPLEVFVSIAPQAYLAERIGDQAIRVHVLVGPGRDPHLFEPSPKQLGALGKARLYIAQGMPFEKSLLEKVSRANPNLKIVDSTRGIRKRRMSAADHHHEGEEHAPSDANAKDGNEGESDADGSAFADPHVWLSPALAAAMARNIAEALIEAVPSARSEFEKRLEALEAELAAAHKRMGERLAPYRGQAFYVFHPAFGYFADAAGLRQEAIEIEGKSPAPRQLAALIKRAKAEGVRVIFVQPQFDKRAAETLARGIGGGVVPIDSMAKDLLKNYDAITAALASSFQAK